MVKNWRTSNWMALVLGVALSLSSVLLLELICYQWNRVVGVKEGTPRPITVPPEKSDRGVSEVYALPNSFAQVPKLRTTFVPFYPVPPRYLDRSRGAIGKLYRSPYNLKESQRFRDLISVASTGEVIYDVEYEIDQYGRRATPQAAFEKRNKHLVLLGCSFVFGLGLDQDSTLAAQLAALAPEYHVYNHGLPGASPSTFIKLAAMDELWQGVGERQGMAVFVYLDDHIPRALGSMSKIALWGGNLPYAFESERGIFEVNGSYLTERPLLTRFYSWLWGSEIVKAFQIDWPWRYGPRQFDSVARMFLQIKKSYLKKFPGQRFIVASYPSAHSFLMPQFKASLEKLGIEHVDYSLKHLEQYSMKPVNIKYDGHPTAEAHRIWSPVLVRDLGLPTNSH